MTKTKKFARWALPAVLVLMIALFGFGLPVRAAVNGDGTSGDTEASVTFEAGEIKLLSAPALDFGSHTISDIQKEYTAVSVGNPLRVSDLRGNGKGWDLVASLSEFKLGEDGGPTLKAASIVAESPTVSAVNGNVGTPPAQPAKITLNSDGQQTPVWSAAESAGMGVWDLVWSTANTKLIVKAGTAQEGTSTATLTWSLQSTP